jgi:hypothetical protein
VHHWLTIAAAMQILFGSYSPFATWYGFTIIAMTFPVDLSLAVRATVSNRYPEQTRRAFTISFYWLSVCLLLNLSGQIFLITNALLPRNFNGPIPVYNVVLMVFAMLGWMYDDFQLLATLRDFATHNYADAEILEKKETSRTRAELEMVKLQAMYHVVDGQTPDTDVKEQTPMTPENPDVPIVDVAQEIMTTALDRRMPLSPSDNLSALLERIPTMKVDDLYALVEAAKSELLRLNKEAAADEDEEIVSAQGRVLKAQMRRLREQEEEEYEQQMSKAHGVLRRARHCREEVSEHKSTSEHSDAESDDPFADPEWGF